jgi:lambda family phage portal protein
MSLLGKLFGTKRERKASEPRRVRASYDIAQTTDENYKHWSHADGLSANAASVPAIRDTIRRRARYEVANAPYLRGIVDTKADWIIGTGPRLQMLTPSDALNRFIEGEVSAWLDRIRMAEKLRTMVKAKTQDGEAFGIFSTNRLLPAVQLDLRLIECDQIHTPTLAYANESVEIDGIEYDADGNPAFYHLLEDHPGGLGAVNMWKSKRLPARMVMHWFRMDRPGQGRGVSELAPSLSLAAILRRYTLAEVAAAENAANFGVALKTTGPADQVDENAIAPTPGDTWEAGRYQVPILPDGWGLDQIKPEHPNIEHNAFVRSNIREMARSVGVPLGIALGDSSDFNYASGRLDHQAFFRLVRIDQAGCEAVVLDPMLSAWVEEARMIPDYLPAVSAEFIASLPHQWFWDGMEHVDPLKEASAQQTRLASNTTTLADEYGKDGKDWEVQLRQTAKEHALMIELGLPIPGAPPPVDPNAPDEPPVPKSNQGRRQGGN